MNIIEIEPIKNKYCQQAIQRWNRIAKPIHSLGLLEDAVVKIAGIQENAEKIQIHKAALVIMCADHGVVAEQVTQTGQDVTRIVSENFTKGDTSAAVMANIAGVDLYPVDIGIATDTIEGTMPIKEPTELTKGMLTNARVRRGTGNIAREPAMTITECEQAIQTGIDIVKKLKDQGYGLIATGEMGIGNTTPSSALATVITGEPVETMTGRGAGLTKDGFTRKIAVVKSAIARATKELGNISDWKGENAVQLLSQLGGLEIAGMMGLFLGGGIYHIPVMMDGFISSVSALMAVHYDDNVKGYILASHVSKEPAASLVLTKIGCKPLLTCEMCLGEGTGAVAAIPLLRMAAAVYHEMSTFQEIHVEEYKPL